MATPSTRLRWSLLCIIALLAVSATGDVTAQLTAPVPYVPGARICVLCDFGGPAGNPVWPKEIGLLAKGPDGLLYSTTPSGGAGASGTIFSIDPASGAMRTLVSFKPLPGATNPLGGLVDGKDGAYYGTTYTGGLFRASLTTSAMKLGTGTIFKYTLGASDTEHIHTFRNGDMTGLRPEICIDKKPCVYSPQQRLDAAGSYPTSAPVRAGDGAFYGVTSYSYNQKYGVLYKVQASGQSAITGLCISGPVPTDPAITDAQLREQCMFNGPNGNNAASLTFNAVDGKLYGVTFGGGPGNLYGTVFQAELNGRVKTIHRFDFKAGSKPYSVLAASDGNLYGTTFEGGTLSNGAAGSGIVYKLTPGGQFTVLYTFTGGIDGSQPIGGLIEARNKDGVTFYYGSTRYGGEGRGVLYRITAGGQLEVLHRHPGQWTATGRTPSTTLFEMDGSFYGTTYQGGTFDGGVLFRLSDVDLPSIPPLSVTPTFTVGKAAGSLSVPIRGQTQPALIEVFTGVVAGQPQPQENVTDDGIKIRVSNCRNPHVLQFIYREKIGADGVAFNGLYTTSNGEMYQFTTDLKNPVWHTDGGAGRPNAFYDHGRRNPTIVTGMGLTMMDQPSFGQPMFLPGAHETWRATAKDYIICNCRVIAEVHWTREKPWIVDLSGGPNVVPDPNRGTQGPPRYRDVSIVPPADREFKWANTQLEADGYVKVPVLKD